MCIVQWFCGGFLRAKIVALISAIYVRGPGLHLNCRLLSILLNEISLYRSWAGRLAFDHKSYRISELDLTRRLLIRLLHVQCLSTKRVRLR